MNNPGLPGALMFVFLCIVTEVVVQGDPVLDDLYNQIQVLKQSVNRLAYQVMMQQNYIEERIRTDAYSGVKTVRGSRKGIQNYISASHLNPNAFAAHDHSNYERTIGLGEIIAVLNGLEFRTRHNDYKLVMPSTQSQEYHAVEDIPFPAVPPEVLQKRTTEEQIFEMREWFKAFRNQDKSVRDYSLYFKPVMCYIEGAWTASKEFSEPFDSDRHSLDADSWTDLHDKTRTASFSGVRNPRGNLAFLPTTIMGMDTKTGLPIYAQWNYRILCNPVNFDIPLSSFHRVDDLTYRMSTGVSIPQVANTRAARFTLFDGSRPWNFKVLDEIFSKIPGKNNYGSSLSLRVFGEDIFSTEHTDRNEPLNTAYYYGAYKMSGKGASGFVIAPLGFNDENLWISMTSQRQVASLEAEQCMFIRVRPRKYKKQCVNIDIRVSYAIPLEIIYLTPLLSWNPYNLAFNEDHNITVEDGRDGSSESKALRGVDSFRFYKTPVEFFKGPLESSGTPETGRNFMYVLDRYGNAKKVASSGTRMIQNIFGVGKVRLRYPIAPVHGEGSSVWKELNALKDTFQGTIWGPPTSVLFQMSMTAEYPVGEHTHDLQINYDEFLMLLGDSTVNVITQEAQGHTHNLVMSYSTENSFRYDLCDGYTLCPDGHARKITLETNNTYTTLP